MKTKNFLKTHLIGSVKERNSRVFYSLVQFIFNSQLHSQDGAMDEDDLKEIIHYKAGHHFKTALNWANENNDRFMAFELLKLEHKAHSSEKEGLECLHNNLSRFVMLPWIIDSFRKFYKEPSHKKWLRAFFNVVIELLLLYLPFIFDMYSDIILAVSYHRIAYVNKTFDESELLECSSNQFNFSCYKKSMLGKTESFIISSYDPVDPINSLSRLEISTNFQHMFKIAFVSTCFLIMISMANYIHSIPFLHIFNLKNPIWPWWKRLITLMVNILFKFLWPIFHIFLRMWYLVSKDKFIGDTHTMHSLTDIIEESIKTVEYGVESSLQLLLQLWLLHPFLSDISTWSNTEVVVRCVTGLANFLTFDTYPACYIEKALGKILLSVILFSLGVAKMKSYKPGQGYSGKSLGPIPIFLSIVAQTIARILTFRSLILMETSLGYFKYALFFFLHFLAVFTIKILFETQLVKETSAAPSDTGLLKRLNLKSTLYELNKFLLSGLSSTIVMIYKRKSEPVSGPSCFTFLSHTFLSHTAFFILILIQNLVLVTLPYMAPDLYPQDDCFTTDSRSKAVRIVVILWFVGVITQVIHYKMAHDWSPLNGPQVSKSELELDFTVPWSRRNRRFKASQQGLKCEKILRNDVNSR
jgi:hypothetical protein